MDLKTLEYMEARVKKGREITKKIDQIKSNIENVQQVRRVNFLNHNHSKQFDSLVGDLTEQMKTAYIQAAEEEIVLLEQELAEL